MTTGPFCVGIGRWSWTRVAEIRSENTTYASKPPCLESKPRAGTRAEWLRHLVPCRTFHSGFGGDETFEQFEDALDLCPGGVEPQIGRSNPSEMREALTLEGRLRIKYWASSGA